MRMHGHGAHDDMRYVPDGDARGVGERDPIERYAERLVDDYGFARARSRRSATEVRPTSRSAPSQALASPMPEPGAASEGVFADEWRAARRRPGAVVALTSREVAAERGSLEPA